MKPASLPGRVVLIVAAVLVLLSVIYSSVEWFRGDLIAWTNVVTSVGVGVNLAAKISEPTLGRKMNFVVGVGMFLILGGLAAHLGHVRLSPPGAPAGAGASDTSSSKGDLTDGTRSHMSRVQTPALAG